MSAPRRRRVLARAFTLVELMVVVVIVGVLAAIGIYMFRQYVFSTRTVEAVSMIQSIRAAQERWRSENQMYLDVSTTMTSWYPMANPGKTQFHWDQPGANDYARWRLLAPTTAAPVRFGYVTKAGRPFTAMAVPVSQQKPTWPPPAQQREPWYVIQAMGDTDADNEKSYYVSSSINGEVYRENEGE